MNLFGEHWYNNPETNERNVELPLAKAFLCRHKDNFKNVVELGAVTCYYYNVLHKIIDLHDRHPKVTNTDGRKFDWTGWDVLSISTIEHILEGFEVLKKIIETANSWLITIPTGFNQTLDEKIEDSCYKRHFIKKSKRGWVRGGDFSCPYLFGRSASCICVLTDTSMGT